MTSGDQSSRPMFEVDEALGELLAGHPDSIGQLTVWRKGDSWAFAGLVVPGLDNDMLQTLEEWGQRALRHLAASDDPEAIGFFRSGVTDREAWYMTAVRRELPNMDFLE